MTGGGRGHDRCMVSPGFSHRGCGHGLISVASFVRRDTLLWSSLARPLITALVGTTLPLII
jgi:hypothetical protein